MPTREVELRPLTRNDVGRIQKWLEDSEITESWFGRYAYGDPAHLGYHPKELLDATGEEWDGVLNNPEHRILSIYSPEGDHIGEFHVAVEEALGDGHVSILIGRKDLWHQGYGTAGMRAGLRKSFTEWGLYRVWVDVPEYNESALSMCEHLGFIHEGTLRKSRPHEGSRFDSVVMGMLSTEYETHSKSERHDQHHKV